MVMRRFPRFLAILAVLAIFLSNFQPIQAALPVDWQSKVDTWVLTAAHEGETEFLVFLSEQADLSGAENLATRQEKGAYVYRALTEVARRTQPAILTALQAQGVSYRSYWVGNLIWVRGSLPVVQAIAQRSDVAHIYANPRVPFDPPIETQPTLDTPQGIEWNLLKVHADQVWGVGYTGQGVVVGGADTGYDWTHPALITQYRGWDGSSADHDYNWHDAIHDSAGNPCGNDSPEPCDDYGHGTHTMGTMVGDDGAGNQIGMAPGARWIGCRNMDNGYGTPERYIECYQWFIAPWPYGGDPFNDGDPSKAPDVINNSWGCPSGEGCNPNSLLQIVQAVRAAGILTAHSAGNSGAACYTVNTPAGIYAESFTVGATTSADLIAGYSSRGPVTVDGSNRRKPDISAPGSDVRSAWPGGMYVSSNGTSMAAPHVAGLVALLISAQPGLAGQVDTLENIIEQSALHLINTSCGSEPGGVPNNVYGWGRIDAWAAYLQLAHRLEIEKTAFPSLAEPGGVLTYTLTVTHTHPISEVEQVILTDTLPAGTQLLSATPPYTLTGDLVSWEFPSLAAGQVVQVNLTVRVPLDASGEITNALYGVRSAQTPPVTGDPVETPVQPLVLEIHKFAPASVAPGDQLTYTLAVTNSQSYAILHSLILSDFIPLNTTFLTATAPYTLESGQVSWSLPELLPGQSWQVSMVVQSPLTFTGTITNQEYGVSSAETQFQPGHPITTQIYALALHKAASAPAVAPGDILTYTLEVTNQHPTSITHQVVLTDRLPAGVEFISASPPYARGQDLITWGVDALEPGAVLQAELVVRVPLTTTLETIWNVEYGARSLQATPARGAPLQTPVVPYQLILDKSAPASVMPGELLTYTLTVSNPHPFAITHQLILTDRIPAGAMFDSATGNYTITGEIITWNLAALAPGASWSVQLIVHAPDAPGLLVNQEYAAWSAEVLTPVSGFSVRTLVGWLGYLPMIIRTP
jgi:uncharacterized repeat protein (TIGR01451 family)